MRKCFCFFRKRTAVVFILLALSFAPALASIPQSDITLKGKSMSAKEVIQLIQKSSGYTFFYKKSDLDRVPLQNIDCSGNIEEILAAVFGGTLEYQIKGKEIILRSNNNETAIKQCHYQRGSEGQIR